MAIDQGLFRKVIGCFATGVTLVTTIGADGRPRGLTANAVCSVSLEPTLVLVCIDHQADTHPAIRERRAFAVSILRKEHEPISRLFATGAPDKFQGLPFRAGKSGLPLLADALAHLECDLVGEYDGGDHSIFVGEVTAAAESEGAPLLFFRGTYLP